jgi:hypothetical protein
MLVLLTDVLQQPGLLQLSAEPKAPHVRAQKGTLQALRQSGATDCSVHTDLHGQPSLNLSPSTVLHRVC